MTNASQSLSLWGPPPLLAGGLFTVELGQSADPQPPGQRRRWLQVKEALLTGLHRPLRSPSKHVNIVVHPGDDVAWHVCGAVGDVGNFLGTKDAVPDVELAELPHKCLCGVKPAPNDVLGRGQNCVSAGSGANSPGR